MTKTDTEYILDRQDIRFAARNISGNYNSLVQAKNKLETMNAAIYALRKTCEDHYQAKRRSVKWYQITDRIENWINYKLQLISFLKNMEGTSEEYSQWSTDLENAATYMIQEGLANLIDNENEIYWPNIGVVEAKLPKEMSENALEMLTSDTDRFPETVKALHALLDRLEAGRQLALHKFVINS